MLFVQVKSLRGAAYVLRRLRHLATSSLFSDVADSASCYIRRMVELTTILFRLHSKPVVLGSEGIVFLLGFLLRLVSYGRVSW